MNALSEAHASEVKAEVAATRLARVASGDLDPKDRAETDSMTLAWALQQERVASQRAETAERLYASLQEKTSDEVDLRHLLQQRVATAQIETEAARWETQTTTSAAAERLSASSSRLAQILVHLDSLADEVHQLEREEKHAHSTYAADVAAAVANERVAWEEQMARDKSIYLSQIEGLLAEVDSLHGHTPTTPPPPSHTSHMEFASV